MKKIAALSFLILISFFAKAQTIVSGGIFSNTTWTKANSPYTANAVVVFPNVTLTIEPGVVVKVDYNLEIRQGRLIAEGTITDSITFIGSLPILGDTLSNITVYFYNALSSRMNYCIIRDNPDRGMEARISPSDTLIIKNSYFTNNGTGIFYIPTGAVYVTDSCLFKNNSTATNQTSGTITNSIIRKNYKGLSQCGNTIIQNCIIDSNVISGFELGGGNTIMNCQIKNNGVGIKCTSGYGSQIHNNIIENDSIGIQLSSEDGPDSIYCNKICNNSTFNIKATKPYNRNVANNYWCTNDSLTVANSIYDGYDNASLGLVYFMPIDTLQCYLITGINNPEIFNTKSFAIYPNPLTSSSTLQLNTQLKGAEVTIYDMLGKEIVRKKLTGDRMEIERGSLESGVYFVRVRSEEKQWVEKVVVQ